MKKKSKDDAYLVGPFIGELYWETYRFAPHIIHLKKENPSAKIVVFTRPGRFDLYGKYIDLFVPLNLKKEKDFKSNCFDLEGFNTDDYKIISRNFRKKYIKRFNIIDRLTPDIDGWRYKVKWQFPRDKMDYDFLPRSENGVIIENFLSSLGDKPIMYVDIEDGWLPPSKIRERYNVINSQYFLDSISDNYDNINSTYVGCLIEFLKKVSVVYGNINYYTSKLALLLGVPLLINEEVSYDKLNLINPLKTMVISTGDNILEGVEIYENNI